MSETLYTYAVPTARLLSVPGSRDPQLLRRIDANYPFAAVMDRMIEQWNGPADVSGDGPRIEISFADAVRQVVCGEPLVGAADGFVYGFAYEAICQAVGRELPCDFLPFDPTRLDAKLLGLGVPLWVSELCYGGPVFPQPEGKAFSSIGSWSAQRLAAAREPIHRVRLPGLGSVVASCVGQVREWYPLLGDGECVVGILY